MSEGETSGKGWVNAQRIGAAIAGTVAVAIGVITILEKFDAWPMTPKPTPTPVVSSPVAPSPSPSGARASVSAKPSASLSRPRPNRTTSSPAAPGLVKTRVPSQDGIWTWTQPDRRSPSQASFQVPTNGQVEVICQTRGEVIEMSDHSQHGVWLKVRYESKVGWLNKMDTDLPSRWDNEFVSGVTTC